MKRFLSFIVLVCFLMSSFFVCADDTKKEDIEPLKSYGIMVGYEDGSLRLDAPVTRAEFAKILCCMGNYAPDPNRVSYKDVSQNHWAQGYIGMSESLGLLKGDENGFFYPERNLTNADVIVELVKLLGYKESAEARGGNPVGYMMVATQTGLTTGLTLSLNDYALRKDVALLATNALDIPVMMQTGFGSHTEFQIMNGENGISLITLGKEFENK